MAVNTARNNRNSGNYIVEAIAAGILLALTPVFIKSSDSYISAGMALAGLFSLAGFLLMQKALHSGGISIVIPLVTASNILTAFAFGIVFFYENVTYIKWFGAAAIILGAFDLARNGKSELKTSVAKPRASSFAGKNHGKKN